MNQQTKVTGVILAGGLARRMNNQDKGLVEFCGKPLVAYAVVAMNTVVDELLINANRNRAAYQAFSYPVISDRSDQFDGPLAGIYSAMLAAQYPVLLVMPCDSPMINAEHLSRLLTALSQPDTDIAVAYDGERLHPVFLALKTELKHSLQAYLAAGERKIDRWLQQHRMQTVDFSDQASVFININTLSELSALESGNE